jgi:hypothetical protein
MYTGDKNIFTPRAWSVTNSLDPTRTNSAGTERYIIASEGLSELHTAMDQPVAGIPGTNRKKDKGLS